MKKKHVHLIGIGGSGLSAIARVLLESGYLVSGSDRTSSPLLESLAADGVRVNIGHSADAIGEADVVVRSSAVTDDNPEVIAARERRIPVLKRSDFLGKFIQDLQQDCIAVAGSHGKTTTTAMIAWMLASMNADPSYIIGGVMKNTGSNAHAGSGHAFVIEADEYDHMFLGLAPQIAVITNIDYDHPDCFPTRQDYFNAFMEFARRLQTGGKIIACVDDPGTRLLLDSLPPEIGVSYGLSQGALYQARQFTSNLLGGLTFEAGYMGQGQVEPSFLAQVSLQAPGEHNMRNALAALAVAHQLGLPLDEAASALGTFAGAGRRFDLRGEASGITLVDDYAHHPTEIRSTLAAARQRYAERRLWVVWQPHTYSRTKALLDDFAGAFTQADRVIVTDIFAAREKVDLFSSVAVVRQMPIQPKAVYIPTLAAVVDTLAAHLRTGDVVIVFSAGDADQITTRLLAILQRREQFPPFQDLRPGSLGGE